MIKYGENKSIELRRSKSARKSKDFGLDFYMYIVERTRDTLNNQIRYYFNTETDPKTYEETMRSQDVSFWKEVINYAMNSIIDDKT